MSKETPPANTDELIVVGIGASAGGLEALESMFDQMPNNCGLAFVIVQHLSPDFKSLMVELLGRHTEMAIYRVTDSMVVEPDSLYLIPPNRDMTIEGGKLKLTKRKKSKALALPIDHFFKSLAADIGENCVGVVLSGTGSDGSRGIRNIHEAGGLVIVQSPGSAKFDGMPRSAIDSDFADVVVTPEKVPKILQEYAVHRDRVALRNELVPAGESALEKIFRAIQQRHRIDFNYYRPTTIGRRIERRIEMDSSIDSLKDYAELLSQDVAAVDQLYSDLLIGVTSFFRDVKPFQSVKTNALKSMLADHPVDEEFRVWVAACATGEEAYSIAILIDECLQEVSRPIQVKVFATDVHRKSINKATTGIYASEQLQGVSEERLARYFSKVENGFQIIPGIRKMVVFAPHNLTKDPPFTRLSLVTCRNFLIYLLPKSQSKVISHFHFGLKKGGYMLLGSSESPGDLANEFHAVDVNNRLYQKPSDVRLKAPFFSDSLIQTSTPPGSYFPAPSTARIAKSKENPLELTSHEILSNLVPPGVVIDHTGKVLQVFRNAGKYLHVGDGLLTSNLLGLVDKDLRLAMGGAIQRSGKSGEPVCYERLQIKSANDEINQVKLTITPLPKGDTPKKFVITFEELPGESSTELLARQTHRIDVDEVSRGQMQHLEQELQHNREILQATIEEMETSNEELQATNEELIASNEELQSANEELHSVNEELFTVNGEYQRKIAELTELTHDFDNLLESTEVHTLFLDNTLCIRKFTPRIAKVLHLLSHDVGRRIDAFLHNINCENLSEKISKVLQTGQLWEESIRDGSETEFLMRLLPYQTEMGVAGVVLTLIDISKIAAAQAATVFERERFERAIQANRDGTWDWPDLTDERMWWSPGCYQLLGYEPDAFPPLHSNWMDLIHPDDREEIKQSSLPDANKCYVEKHEKFEYRMLHKSGEYRWYCHRAIVDRDETGRVVRMTGSIADIEDRIASEMLANEGIRLRDNFLSMLSHELRNPMGAVMSAMENIDTSLPSEDSDAGKHELAVIGRQTHQMARLLDDLLDVARFGRDKIEFRKEILDLCELVDTVIETVDHQLKEKNQMLKTSICEGPLYIIGDPSRIAQAQTNLIVNASKFSKPGQDVLLTLQRDGKEAVITVTDNGVGIAPELLESVFDLFMQSETTLDRTAGGMGVGLSLAQKIIRAHNGTISASSEGIGHGCTFTIRIPLTTLTHDKRDPSTLQGVDQSLVCKVLLVEDNEDARQMLTKTFSRRGFEVLATADGKSAIEQFSEFEPEVAVIDIGLPGISGYEVAKAFRADSEERNVMLVALTGYGQSDEKERVFEAGFDHHIIKPLQFNHLHQLILGHLSQQFSDSRRNGLVAQPEQTS